MRRIRARLVIALVQNAIPLTFVAGWLGANALVFARGHPLLQALEIVFGLVREETVWGRIYQPFTQVVVFGLVVSLIVTNVTRRHRPEATARLLAREARDHVVVIGHTHLGERVRDAALERGIDVVVVDDDQGRVSSLLHDESPLVLADPRTEETLLAASIERAHMVAVAWDGAEVAAIAARIVRKHNPSCELVLRCPDDDVGEVLARTYRARIVSTSRLIAKRVVTDAVRRGTRRAVVFGDNEIARKTHRGLVERGIESKLGDAPEAVGSAELVVIADDDLGKNLIRVDRIRDHAPHARIVCRAFDEEAAEILTRPPFRCEVLSSSRLAIEAIAAEGKLASVTPAARPLRRALA